MSEANGKVCCNCRHCIRIGGDINHVTCRCDLDDSWLSYVTVMTHWCRHWSRNKAESEEIEDLYSRIENLPPYYFPDVTSFKNKVLEIIKETKGV